MDKIVDLTKLNDKFNWKSFTDKKASKILLENAILVDKDFYSHTFKYELEWLINEFINTDKKIKGEKLKEIFFAIGWLKNSRKYKELDLMGLVF